MEVHGDSKTICAEKLLSMFTQSPTLSKAFPLLHGTKDGTPFSLFMKLANA